MEVHDPLSAQAMRTEVERSSLVLRLEGHGALDAISPLLTQVGRPFAAMGSMAPRLGASARVRPHAALSGAQMVLLLCDAICTRGQPIRSTVEPRSLALRKSERVDHRAAEPWKQPWAALADAGLREPQTVGADQGAGWVKGWALLGLMHHPDVGHRLRPLAMGGDRCSRQARAAIAGEAERGGWEVGRSAPGIHQRMESSEAAQAAAAEKSSPYEHGCSLWAALRQALAWFDSAGRRQDGASRQAASAAILALIRALGCAQLPQALASCASGWEGSWGSDRRAEDSYQSLLQRSPRAVGEGCACGWQWQRQSTHSKDDGLRKRWAPEAECDNA